MGTAEAPPPPPTGDNLGTAPWRREPPKNQDTDMAMDPEFPISLSWII